MRNLQRVQDARLIAIDRRFDNLQQFQQQYPSNDPVTEIPGLSDKTLDELVAFEKKIKINENFFEFVSIIPIVLFVKLISNLFFKIFLLKVRFIRTIGGTSTAKRLVTDWGK